MAKIRRLREGDGSEWVRMRTALWPGSLSEHQSEVEAYFAERSDLPVVFVAEDGERIVGFLELDFRKYAPGCESSPVAFIEGWYVDPEERRCGIGRDLIRQAEAFARSYGSAEIASDAEIDNAQGIAAHRNVGFDEVERIVCFRRLLPKQSEASNVSTRAVVRDVMPVLMCRDVGASVSFYRQLAFDLLFQDESEKPKYAVVRRDSAQIHLQWANEDQWRVPIDRPTYRLLVSDVDRLYGEFLASGSLKPSHSPWAAPATTPWRTREFHMRDPDGNGLQFYVPA